MSKQDVLKVVPARYPLRPIGALLALFILAAIVQSVAGNPRWEWGVFARWFFEPAVLAGLGQTLLLTLLGTAAQRGVRQPAGAGATVALLPVGVAGLGLYLAVSLAAADCGADHPVQLFLPVRHPLAGHSLHLGGVRQLSDHRHARPVRRGGGGPDAGAERLHRRDHPRRHFWASITGSTKRPPRWACRAGAARCASFCRRRCAPSFRPASTRSSASPKAPRWFTCWRCRSCFIPSR